MGGYVCTVAGGNGGVGKTTTAVNLATVLETNGYDTVVIDADLAMPNVGEMLGIEVDKCLHDVLAGEATVSETLTAGPGGLTVIPGEPSLDAFAEADPGKLWKVANTLSRTHDAVIIDTAAGLSKQTTVPLELADGVVLVTTPDHVSLADTGKTGTIAELVDSDILGVVLVRATPETPVREVEEEFAFPLLGGIPDDLDAVGSEPLVLERPESAPATAYTDLADELEPVFFEGESVETVAFVPREWFE